MGSVPNQPRGGVLAPGPSKHMRSSRGFLGCSEPRPPLLSSPLLSHLAPLLLGFSPSPAFFAHPHLPPRANPTSCLEPGAPRCSSSTKSPGCDSPSPKGGQEPAQPPKTLFLLPGSLQMSPSPPCWKAKPSPAGGQRCAGPRGINPRWLSRTKSITKTQFWISQQPRAVPGAWPAVLVHGADR